jgi:signal transduction histidine kinase
MILYDMRDYRQSLTADLATQADILGQSSVAALLFDDAEAARENLLTLKAKPNVIAGALYNARGVLFALYTRSDVPVSSLPTQPHSEGASISGNEVVLVHKVVENGQVLGAVYLRGDYPIATHLRHYAAIVGGVLAVSFIASLLMCAWLESTVTAPILAMRDVAQKVVEKRDFSLRVDKTTEDEIGYLAEAFNGMLAEIGERTQALLRAEDELRGLNAELEQRVTKRTEELAAANKELESFSYSVSHDLRAPVRAIAGFSKLLAEQHETQLDPEARRKLGIVRSEAARMGALIDDLLAFSRLGRQSIQLKPVDMRELVRANLETLNAGHTEHPPEVRVGELPETTGDRSLLAQVWANLLANSYKFSAKKEQPLIEVDAYTSDAEHVYFVRDNGVGFDPKYVSKLFGVFQRLHDPSEFPGTGVGLALVQRIIARHGGRVWAEGEPGVGATFYFSLPRRNRDGPV